MFAIVKDDKIVQYLQIDVPFILNDIQYPANWLRLAPIYDRHNLGIYEIVTSYNPTNFDDRFYWQSNTIEMIDNENKIVNRITNGIEKNLDQLKKDWITSIKQVVNANFNLTDWYVIRKIETGIEIPKAITEYRVAMRQKSNELETQINSCSTVSDLMNIVLNIAWPKRKDLVDLTSNNDISGI